MPIYAHGLVGIGIGAASIHSARSAACRRCWIGCAALLAYLPHLTEWLARALGWQTIPVSATTSIPCIAAFSLLFVTGVRQPPRRDRPLWLWRWGETSPVILAAGVAAIVSHLLLNWADGGAPLFWPVTSLTRGPDWFGLHSLAPLARLRRELVLFGPAALAGIVVFALRELAAPRPVLVRGRVLQYVLGQLLWMTPLFALAGFHAYILAEQIRGDELWERGDYAGALPYYIRSARVPAIDGPGRGFTFKLAWCHQTIGNEEAAYGVYTNGLKLYADCAPLYTGLAEFYLTAKDPRFQHPERVPELAGKIRQFATREYEPRDADRLVARAEENLELSRRASGNADEGR